ncbi:MAG: sulfatase-like hydrolase/transferase [Elusimicrobiota bacterium]
MHERLNFNQILETVKKALVLNGIFLILMTALRVVFYFYFSNPVELKGLYGYVIKAFVLGARYDLVIVAYLNIFVTLSLFAVWALDSRKIFMKWINGLRLYYFIMYSFVFFILFVDFGFYSYFKNHINIIIFGVIEDDTFALLKTIAKNGAFPVACVIIAGTEYLIFVICRRFGSSIRKRKTDAIQHRKRPGWFKAAFACALFVCNGLAARGSLKMFPLGTMDAAISPNAFINKLSLNGFFTLGEAVEARWAESKGNLDLVKMAGYEGRPEQAFADFLGKGVNKNDLSSNLRKTTARNEAAERIRPNVILIVMEGFGADLLSYNGPDFNVLGELKKHFDSDYVFYNFLPADIGTIGSLESIFLNIPKRPQSKFISQSRYAFKAFPSSAALPFNKAGYSTVFVYGGNLGWRNLIMFLPVQGFETVAGEGAMSKEALKNEWGVYDEYLFDYIYEQLSRKNGKPKFIMAMSTGNHPPYSVPRDYKVLPLKAAQELERRITGDRKLAMKRFATYQYANQKLGELITKIKKSEFGKNTIIAVTGDHNFWDVFDYGTERLFDRFSVPFYVYAPGALKPARADTSVFGSHIDIMPTLFNLALSKSEYVSVGVDLFDPKANHESFISEGYIFSKEGAASCSLAKDIVAYYGWDKTAQRMIIPAQETAQMKKRVRYYRSAIAVTDYFVNDIK